MLPPPPYPGNVVAFLLHEVAIDVRAAKVNTRNLRFMVPPNSFTTAFLKPSNLNLIIFLRVAPDDLKKLLGSVEKLGKILEHTTEREDKTTVVVDTEAKIKNLTTFRDNLRAMLAKP